MLVELKALGWSHVKTDLVRHGHASFEDISPIKSSLFWQLNLIVNKTDTLLR